jgi:Rab-like protein 2
MLRRCCLCRCGGGGLVDYKVTSKSFNFAAKRRLPFQFVSASDGTNVVKVFQAAVMAGKQWKESPPDDYFSEVMALLGEVRPCTCK